MGYAVASNCKFDFLSGFQCSNKHATIFLAVHRVGKIPHTMAFGDNTSGRFQLHITLHTYAYHHKGMQSITVTVHNAFNKPIIWMHFLVHPLASLDSVSFDQPEPKSFKV